MKRLCSLIVALLLCNTNSSNSYTRYYCCIIFQDGSCYEEYIFSSFLDDVALEFVSDSNIESVFFTRDINYVPKTNLNR